MAVVDAVILALALSLDSAAIAAACGAAGMARGDTLRMALVFGVFHIVMGTLGWLAGAAAASWMADWDHWVAFGLLAIIGTKMVITALRSRGPAGPPATWTTLIGLAVATSLDAVAAGVTLPLLPPPPAFSIGLVGGTVFVVVLISVRIGAAIGGKLGRVFDVLGGLAVIGIGVRILIEHLS